MEPSPIRVEADEVTYSLHIVLRFLLEKDLVTGDLPPRDLPDAWNGLSRELLGLTPKTDAQGVLQDIHWSLGAIGYFPTYALGNLYAAQFYAALRRDLPDMDDRLSRRDMAPILEWLRIHIHLPGASRTAADLVRDATGAPLDPSFFIRYLSEKYGELYGL
ncbi:MAG: putative metalloprotease YpwA [Synergistetes bacterium ADurb.Bin520]|nr:MAG: putative metalloprotease YpwA [Synergistetes bacterium ADurb.Bin520]